MPNQMTDAIVLLLALSPLLFVANVACVLAWKKRNRSRKSSYLLVAAAGCIVFSMAIFVTTVVVVMNDVRVMNSGYVDVVRIAGFVLWTAMLSTGILLITRAAIIGRTPMHLDLEDSE